MVLIATPISCYSIQSSLATPCAAKWSSASMAVKVSLGSHFLGSFKISPFLTPDITKPPHQNRLETEDSQNCRIAPSPVGLVLDPGLLSVPMDTKQNGPHLWEPIKNKMIQKRMRLLPSSQSQVTPPGKAEGWFEGFVSHHLPTYCPLQSRIPYQQMLTGFLL